MVCIPCFAAPVLLFIWYKFLYPLFRPILERYFGDRFALPADPDHCPICPIGSKGKCDQATAVNEGEEEDSQEEGGKISTSQRSTVEGIAKEEVVVNKSDDAKKVD